MVLPCRATLSYHDGWRLLHYMLHRHAGRGLRVAYARLARRERREDLLFRKRFLIWKVSFLVRGATLYLGASAAKVQRRIQIA